MTGPESSVDELLAEIIGRLAAAPPLVRWQVLRALAGQRGWLQALTVRQLLGGRRGRRTGMGDLARTLGVTTGRVSQLAAAAPPTGPLTAWGRVLAVAGELAVLGERPGSTGRLREEYAQLLEDGLGLHGEAMRPRVEEAARRWAMAARRRGQGEPADRLLVRLDGLLDQAGDTPSVLTLVDRAEIAIGYQEERAALAPR
jgi:hypothetical protein